MTEIPFGNSFLALDTEKGCRGQEARVFSSLQEVSGGLRQAGYIADSVAATTVFLAASLHRPVFTEGPAGSGKTQLAYAVAAAARTTVERLQCYEGIGEDKAIGKFDESLVSLGRASELCQMPVEQFMEFAAQHNAPLHYGADQLEEDRRTLERLGL